MRWKIEELSTADRGNQNDELGNTTILYWNVLHGNRVSKRPPARLAGRFFLFTRVPRYFPSSWRRAVPLSRFALYLGLFDIRRETSSRGVRGTHCFKGTIPNFYALYCAIPLIARLILPRSPTDA